jgi:hypothetical protein
MNFVETIKQENLHIHKTTETDHNNLSLEEGWWHDGGWF